MGRRLAVILLLRCCYPRARIGEIVRKPHAVSRFGTEGSEFESSRPDQFSQRNQAVFMGILF